MDFPKLTSTTEPYTQAVHTSKPAQKALQTMKNAYNQANLMYMQHAQNKAIQASQKVNPTAQAAQSGMPFEQMLQANPSAAYFMAHGTTPPTQQHLTDFQNRMQPDEVFNDGDLKAINDLITMHESAPANG